uniref:Uncharacterized protein n=1 Tax=Chelonoidis abingdonii TaxID=106734 RepID=A0A8C0JEN1_CHEAB
MASKIPAKSKGKKRKRVVLALKQKIDICTRLEKGENRNVLMQEYDVGSSTIYDIRAQKGQLFKFFASCKSNKAVEQRRTLHMPRLEQLDSVLYEWFSFKQSEGASISGPMLIEKAKVFYKQMQLTEPCAFSDGWLSCFKVRHSIRKLDVSSEQKSADREAAEKYCEFFRNLIAEHDLSPEQIYNADETCLFWRCLPNSTLAGASESRAAGFKQNKDRLTVLTCANAAGSHKIKLLVTGKYNHPRAFKSVAHLPVYRAQGNSWMNKEIFYDWFHHVFVPAVKEHFRKISLPEDSKAILLLNNCRAHSHETELVSVNIFAIFLPASVTSLIQPMDQGIIQNMKYYYRRDFLRELINHEGTVQDFQSHNIKDAIFNVACAWNSVKSETLRRARIKLWPSVMFAEVSSDEDEFEGFKVRVRKNTLSGLKLTRSEEDKITWGKAASAFDTIITFAERQPCYTAQEVMQLHILHSTFMQKRQKTSKQADVRDLVKKTAFRIGLNLLHLHLQ